MQSALRRDGERLYLFGARIDNLDRGAALRRIEELLDAERGRGTRRVYFTNVHSVRLARDDGRFRELLGGADLVLGDGSGLLLATRLLGDPMLENLNGTDLTPQVLEIVARRGGGVFLLGAKPEVLAGCQRHLARTYPGLRICGARHGYFSRAEEPGLVEAISAASPDLLLVALGSPRQEAFLTEHAGELRVGVSMAVGGLFDFLSGDKRRAPSWVRRAGLEFVVRLAQDPRGKWQRVFVEIPEFLARVLVHYLAGRLAGR